MFNMKKSRKGFTISELVIVMVIIAILWAASFIGRAVYIERAKMTTLRSDFNNFEYALQQVLLEHPTIGTLSQKDQVELINTYLADEIRFTTKDISTGDDTATGDDELDLSDTETILPESPLTGLVCVDRDPWDINYHMIISTADNPKTGDAFGDDGTSTGDTEYRIFIKSNGKNNKTSETATALDGDDCILMLQMVNGNVTTASWGLDTDKGSFAFNGVTDTGSDTASDATLDLTAAYSK